MNLPWKTVLRCCSAVLHERARELLRKVDRASTERLAGRQKQSARLRDHAVSLGQMTAEQLPGCGIGDSIAGQLIAWCSGYDAALTELIEGQTASAEAGLDDACADYLSDIDPTNYLAGVRAMVFGAPSTKGP